jgi:hypothetical protein
MNYGTESDDSVKCGVELAIANLRNKILLLPDEKREYAALRERVNSEFDRLLNSSSSAGLGYSGDVTSLMTAVALRHRAAYGRAISECEYGYAYTTLHGKWIGAYARVLAYGAARSMGLDGLAGWLKKGIGGNVLQFPSRV